jgi:hypothetical protein
MNIVHAFFMISFIICIVILLLKIYNLLSVGEWYDIKMGFMLFIVYLLAWLVGLVCVLMDLNVQLLITLFKLQTWLMLVNVVALLVELFLLAKIISQPQSRPHMSNQNEYRR